MSKCEQREDTSVTEPGSARRKAEDRVRQVVANARIKAENCCHDADSRALDLLETHRQRAFATCRRIETGLHTYHAGCHVDRLRLDPCDRPRHEEIARRAYFKAEQRHFEAGQETDDWLQAERELLQGSCDWRE